MFPKCKSTADPKYEYSVNCANCDLGFTSVDQKVKYLLRNSAAGFNSRYYDKSVRNAPFYVIREPDGKIEFVSVFPHKENSGKRNDGYTALHYAITSVNVNKELIVFLLKHKTNVNAINNEDGCTALHYAVINPNTNEEIIKLLLKYRANVNIKNNLDGCTALHYAIKNPNVSYKIIELLLKHKANISAKNSFDGCTALHYAVRNPIVYPDIVELLLKNGADIHAKDKNGDTPVYLSVLNALNLKVVKILLRRETKFFTELERILSNFSFVKNNRMACLEFLKYFVVEQVKRNLSCINEFYNCRSVTGNIYLNFISGLPHRDILFCYIRQCVCEIIRMTCCNISKHYSCYVFVFSCNMSKIEALVNKTEVNIDRVLSIWCENKFPIYMDMILDKIQYKIKREDVMSKLEETRIFTMSHAEGPKGIIFLNFHSVRAVAEYLTLRDLLCLLKTFYEPV